MGLKADTVAQVSFKDIGHSNFLNGEGLGSFASVAYKRTVNGTTYTFKTTDTTYKRLRSLKGSSLTISRPIGPVTAKGSLELGSVNRLAAELISKWTSDKGRSVELKALWSEKSGATLFTLIGQPHNQLKLRSTLNSRNQAVTSDADLRYKGFTLSPAIKWKTGEKGVSLSHRFRAGTLKGSYAADKQVGGLEYTNKPYKIGLVSPLAGKSAYRPTLTLGFEKEFDLSDLRKSRFKSGAKAEKGGKVDDVRRDISLDTKLKELDAVYQPRIEKAKARKEEREKAVR